MTEPVKVLPMAQLLRLAREKEAREREVPPPTPGPQAIQDATVPDETILHGTIVQQTPVSTTIPNETIVEQDIEKPSDNPPKSGAKKSRTTWRENESVAQSSNPAALLDVSKGYYPSYNDLSDRLIPEMGLTPFEQSVLQRLYRLSRGWKSEECEVGLGTLAKFCVMSRSQVQRSVAALIEKGLVVSLGPAKKGSKDGNRYRVLPGVPTMPPQTMVKQTIVSEKRTLPPENTEVTQTIVTETTNKNSNKEVLKTQTQTPSGVRGGSKFTLDECRAYAESLRGEGIQNPGGYATAIHRSGEADDRIEAFLKRHASKPEPPMLETAELQEQANAVVSMLRHGSTIKEVERLMAGSFRPSQWYMIRSIALAQAKVSGRPAESQDSED